MRSFYLISIFLFFVTLFKDVVSQDPNEVLRKMDEALYCAKDRKSEIEIITYDRSGRENVRKAITMQKGHDKRIFRFIEPPSQAGIGLLSLPNDVMYLYMPAYEKERRIATSLKNQNFAGTDFSYDDMEIKLYQEKYDAISVKKEGADLLLELVPKPNTKSQYSKLIILLGSDSFYPKNVKYFDKSGNLIKELENHKIEKIGDCFIATSLEMKSLKNNTKTKMIFYDTKINTGISDDEFTVRKLIQK